MGVVYRTTMSLKEITILCLVFALALATPQDPRGKPIDEFKGDEDYSIEEDEDYSIEEDELEDEDYSIEEDDLEDELDDEDFLVEGDRRKILTCQSLEFPMKMAIIVLMI